MDNIDARMKRLVSYINRKSRTSTFAVEPENYGHEKFEITMPKIYGKESKKEDPRLPPDKK